MLLQCQMVVQDRLEKEKGIAKNAVEAYVYDMRGKLYGELERFITAEVCTTLYLLGSICTCNLSVLSDNYFTQFKPSLYTVLNSATSKYCSISFI